MMNRLTIIFVLMIAIAAACSDGDNLSPEEGNPTTDTIPPPPCAEAVDSLACIHQLKFDSLVSAQALLRDSLLEIGWIPFFGFECKGPFTVNELPLGKKPAVLIPPDARYDTVCFRPLKGPEFHWNHGAKAVYGANPCVNDAVPVECKGVAELTDDYYPIIHNGDTLALVSKSIYAYDFHTYDYYAKVSENEILYYFFRMGASFDSARLVTSAIANSFFLYDEPGS